MSVPKSFRQMAGIPASKVTASSGTSALLVIDPQKSYDTGSPLEISDIDARQKVISGVVDKYREAKAPVIWVQVSSRCQWEEEGRGGRGESHVDAPAHCVVGTSTRREVERPSLIQTMRALSGSME